MAAHPLIRDVGDDAPQQELKCVYVAGTMEPARAQEPQGVEKRRSGLGRGLGGAQGASGGLGSPLVSYSGLPYTQHYTPAFKGESPVTAFADVPSRHQTHIFQMRCRWSHNQT
jgi:hypothetical protein